jgi:hypothetical protein
MLGMRGRFVFLETRQPITASLIISTLQDTSISSGDSCFPPSILEDLYNGSSRHAAVEASPILCTLLTLIIRLLATRALQNGHVCWRAFASRGWNIFQFQWRAHPTCPWHVRS